MPIYEYECRLCGAIVEHIQRSTHPHPSCCGTDKKRHPSTVMALRFPSHAKTPSNWTVEKGEKKDA